MADSSQTHINLYGGSPLNRLSWLRTSQSFLNAIIASPNARWLIYNAGHPLMLSEGSTKRSPAYLSTADMIPLLGPEPFFGQGQDVGELLPDVDSEVDKHSPVEAVRHRGLRIVFLGIHEEGTGRTRGALPTSELSDPHEAIKRLGGTPYFTADISELEKTPEELEAFLNETSLAREGKKITWTEPRSLMASLDHFTAAVMASARTQADWNLRNKFCPGCGSPSYSMWGGWKLACNSLLPWVDNSERSKPCFTAKGLHNFTHPRTDAVVIMIAIDETGDKVLLGRGKRFPGKFYSALAGFIEPGETLEDAVAREMWEEAGVHVWDIRYHSGQPWPYPANLMVGFYARADSTQPIRTDLDNELVDARWFTRQEIRQVLDHVDGTRFKKEDVRKMVEAFDERSNTEGGQDPKGSELEPVASACTPCEGPAVTTPEIEDPTAPPFTVPGYTAIAGVLIRDWADGKIGFAKSTERVNGVNGANGVNGVHKVSL